MRHTASADTHGIPANPANSATGYLLHQAQAKFHHSRRPIYGQVTVIFDDGSNGTSTGAGRPRRPNEGCQLPRARHGRDVGYRLARPATEPARKEPSPDQPAVSWQLLAACCAIATAWNAIVRRTDGS